MIDNLTDITSLIKKRQLEQLFLRSKSTILALLISCSIYILLLYQHNKNSYLIVWYLIFIVVLSGRWLLARHYKARQQTFSLSFWLQIYRLGILATGLMIGSLNILFFPSNSLNYLLLAIIFPFGIIVGAVTMLLDFLSFFIYSVTLMLPIVYQTTMGRDHSYFGTGALTSILILFFLKFSKDYNGSFVSSLKLGYENEMLLDQLQLEKNKLNNRLGRILNDSSNEIYVVDADSFICLQVNRGVVENLGYDADELASISILEIFTKLDKEALQNLIAPLTDGSKEFVMHQGENRRKDGSLYPVEARIQLSTEDSPPIIIITVQNISERAEWEEKLIYQANFDLLTGLPNRNYIQSVITTAFTRAKRKKEKLAVLFLDLDNFKTINDSLGHRIGDEVLKLTAERIRNLLRESDVPARTGGDEFTILLEGLQNAGAASMIAEKLIEAFRQPFVVDERELFSTLSIGISIFPDDGDSLEPLMKYADMAMYQAKESGRNKFCFFSKDMCKDA
ncbi:MAG: GGDEF domain-containing protein, partial [Desulfobulbus sp.]